MIARLAAIAIVVVVQYTPLKAAELVFPVPVATIYPGELIEQGMVTERAFHPSLFGRTAMVPERGGLVGKVARRTLLPGRPVPAAAVAEPELVKRGVPVELVFREGGLIIRAQAMSLEGGSAGALIRVRNIDSGLIVSGVVQPDGSIRVGSL